MADSGFPHHTIASLRQVGMMGLTPLQRMSRSALGLKLKSRCSLGSPHTLTSARNLFMHRGRLGRSELSSGGCTLASAAKRELACIAVACWVLASYGVRLLFLFLVEEVALDVDADAVIVAFAKPVC